MNIKTIKNVGAKKLSKTDTLDHLMRVIELNENNCEEIIASLAVLYEYFKIPVSKKAASDKWSWVAQAVSTDPYRTQIHSIYLDGSMAVATDGRRLHCCPRADEFPAVEDGGKTFDVDKNRTNKEGVFPEWTEVVPQKTDHRTRVDTDSISPDKMCGFKKGRYAITNLLGFWYNTKYLKEAMAGSESVEVSRTELGVLLIKHDDGRYAVLMNVRDS